MQVIGFNLTKISAERPKNLTKKADKNLKFEFTDLEKEKVNMLKDTEAIKIYFKHTLSYENEGDKNNERKPEIIFEGHTTLSLSKEDAKKITKSWKKKQIPNNLRIHLSNLILHKCSPKTLELQHELGLPSHIPIPRLSSKE